MKKRSPNLTVDRVDAVVAVIRSWDGKLTWPALIKSLSTKTNATYTRQALHNQERIRAAYEIYKSRLRGDSDKEKRPVSAALRASLARINRLEQEKAELEMRERLLLEQFVRWAYNAAARGLSEDALNRPLPPLNRTGNLVSRGKPRDL